MAAPRWAAEAAGRLGVPTDSLLLHSDLDALQLAPSPLPPAVGQMHQRALVGPFLLQILQACRAPLCCGHWILPNECRHLS